MHCSYVSASVHSEAETLMIAIKRGLKYGKRRQIVPAHVAPLELWHVLFSPNTHELKASEYEYAEAQLLRWQISQLCSFQTRFIARHSVVQGRAEPWHVDLLAPKHSKYSKLGVGWVVRKLDTSYFSLPLNFRISGAIALLKAN